MSELLKLQRRIAKAVMQPLVRGNRMRRRSLTGASVEEEAQALIKPNSVLTSFQRLEIYNRQYWFRVLSCFRDDFPGLRAIVGSRKFEGLMRAYLADCPSQSFTLRNLGSRLENWLRANPDWIQPRETLALDMAQLEWAHIEAFDSGYEPPLTPPEVEPALAGAGLYLQPYIRLLNLTYPVDDLLIDVHDYAGGTDGSSNAARSRQFKRRVQRNERPEQEPIHLVVHRADDSVYYKRVEPEAFRMLKALVETHSLDLAFEAAFADSSMPDEERVPAVQQWFANWAELCWFCRPPRHIGNSSQLKEKGSQHE